MVEDVVMALDYLNMSGEAPMWRIVTENRLENSRSESLADARR